MQQDNIFQSLEANPFDNLRMKAEEVRKIQKLVFQILYLNGMTDSDLSQYQEVSPELEKKEGRWN